VCWYNYAKMSQMKAKAQKTAAAAAAGVADEEAPAAVDTSKEPGTETKSTQ
jgi:hypothetical protein